MEHMLILEKGWVATQPAHTNFLILLITNWSKLSITIHYLKQRPWWGHNSESICHYLLLQWLKELLSKAT